MRKKVTIALNFQGSSPADYDSVTKQSLERYDSLLPTEISSASSEDATAWLQKPTGPNVLSTQRGGIPLSRKPRSINKQAFWQDAHQSV